MMPVMPSSLWGMRDCADAAGFPAYPYIYDLGEEWYQWTSLPSVFARWMVRKDLARQEAIVLEDTLYVGMQDGGRPVPRLRKTR